MLVKNIKFGNGFGQLFSFMLWPSNLTLQCVYVHENGGRFDLFLPTGGHKPRPAVIFVTGGAWVIGYVRLLDILKSSSRIFSLFC